MSAYAAEIFEMVLNSTPIAAAWKHAEAKEWKITREEFDADIQSAFESLAAKGTPDSAVERGRAIERLHRLWAACMKIQDYGKALAAQRELDTLLGLKTKPKASTTAADKMREASASARAIMAPASNGTTKRRKVKT